MLYKRVTCAKKDKKSFNWANKQFSGQQDNG